MRRESGSFFLVFLPGIVGGGLAGRFSLFPKAFCAFSPGVGPRAFGFSIFGMIRNSFCIRNEHGAGTGLVRLPELARLQALG